MFDDPAETEPKINPLEKTRWTLPDWIKQSHKAKYYWDEEKEQRVPQEDIVGTIISTVNDTVLFSYGTRSGLERNIPYWAKTQVVVLQVYLGVSFDSFQKAEQLYSRTQDLDSIEDFLSG